MKFAPSLIALIFCMALSNGVIAKEGDVGGNSQGTGLPEGDVGGNSQKIGVRQLPDIAGNGQTPGVSEGDVGGNSQDTLGFRWTTAVAKMNESDLLRGHYGENGKLVELARAVHERFRQSPPEPRDLGEAMYTHLTPSQIIETLTANLLEQLGETDRRSITEIGALLGADR